MPTFPLMMLWTAPTTCIAIEQNAIGFEEQWRLCELPLMAMNGHAAARNRLPLFPQLRTFPGQSPLFARLRPVYPQERTFRWPSLTSGFDPTRTFVVLGASAAAQALSSR